MCCTAGEKALLTDTCCDSFAEDLSASEKAELAASRGRYPGRALKFLLGGPLGGVINVGAAVKYAAQTPVLSWAVYKVRSGRLSSSALIRMQNTLELMPSTGCCAGFGGQTRGGPGCGLPRQRQGVPEVRSRRRAHGNRAGSKTLPFSHA